MHNRAALLLVLTISLASAVDAQDFTIARWNHQLTQSTKLLTSGKHAAALKIAERVIREMIGQLGSGEAATRAFGIVVSHKALALAGLGREEDALWYWHSVLTLYPALAQSDLSTFGEAGAFLAAHREPRPPADMPEGLQEKPPDVNVQVPKLLRRVNPEYPAGALSLGASGTLIVEVMITKDGKVTAPRVVEPLPAPTMSYTALEALRRWRFEPGRLNGEPVDVILDLTVSFKSSR
ncbi:MAG: energy transducer TonB [Acidobacteriota bacterium]|nr:energy transducer TonB [Acidobacteriota bacterium]